MNANNDNDKSSRFLKRLYMVRDFRVNQCNTPISFSCDEEAIRAFGDAIRRGGDSLISLHPEDFGLFYIGDFDSETGELLPSSACLVASGDNFKKE